MLLNKETDDDLGNIEFNGLHFEEFCKSEGWKRHITFILNSPTSVKDFLIKVADKAQIALEHEKTFNVLKDKKLNVLDDAPF